MKLAQKKTFKLVMLPPQSPVYLEWGAKVREQNPNISLIQPESLPEAVEMIQDADAAFGFMPMSWKLHERPQL